MKEIEKRISGIKDSIEEINISVKVDAKSEMLRHLDTQENGILLNLRILHQTYEYEF
jgi:hypothetical protein